MSIQDHGQSAKKVAITSTSPYGGPAKMNRKALGLVVAIVLLLIAGFTYFFFSSRAPLGQRADARVSIDALGIRFTQNESLMQYGGLVWASPNDPNRPIVFYSTPTLNNLGPTCNPTLAAAGDVKAQWVGIIEKLPASEPIAPGVKLIKRIGDSNIVSIEGHDLCVPDDHAAIEGATQTALEESLQTATAE